MLKLKPCPICKGEVTYNDGYYYDGRWIWPSIYCNTQYCGLKYQPIIYPDKGEIFERWNNA